MIMGVRAGIYLGDDRLTVAVAARRGGVQCFTVELDDLPGAHLKTELDARQLRPKRIRLGLARPLVTVKALELPRAEGGQLAEMVAFELERHVPFPPEDMRFDWTTLTGTAKGPVRILVVAAERRTVDGALRLLEEPRIKPAALTVACHDLPALLARRSKVRAAVWAHRAGGSIDLVCLGQGRIQLSRTVPAGDGEALAADVAATLSLLGWTECDAIWASGDGADELLASPALEQLAASVTAPPWNPAVEAMLPGLPADDQGRATLALAVALGSQRPPLNLLSVELRPRTFSSGQLVTAGMVAMTVALGAGLVLGQGYKQQRYATQLSDALRKLDPDVKAVERLSAELAQKRRLLETVQSIEKADVRPLPIMRELTERLPQDAWLRTLSMDKQGLEITGQAAAANQLIPLLENSPSLARVEFTAPVTKAGDKEQFRIKAAWKSAPPPEAPQPTPATGAKPPASPGRPGTRPGAAQGR
jgi:general secretion pathway protein L